MRASSIRAPPALSGCLRVQPTPRYVCRQCIITASSVAGTRGIKISSAPATEFPRKTGSDAFGSTAAGSVRDESDACFEVLGSPYSLLSVTLSASQKLYTRRGTLVSVAGKLENAQSTLSILAPVRRGLLGVPFLYQRITSTTPLTLLIGTKAASTTLFTLHLDGTTDWVVAQRGALLAWTGHTLTVTPQRQTYGGTGLGLGLGLANWGSSFLTGRGLAALSAPGYIYPVTLAAGEELAVHPSHVVAYAVNRQAPRPFRLREGGAAAATKSATTAIASAASSTAAGVGAVTARLAGRLHLQTPAIPAVPESVSGFWKTVRETAAYKRTARTLFAARTLLRQTIWGDRLFVLVRGPTTLLLSSRGVRVSDVLTRDDVNEIADTEAGVVPAAVERATRPAEKPKTTGGETAAPTASSSETVALHVASVRQDGKVEFTDAKDLKQFVR